MAGRLFMAWNDLRFPEPDYRCGMSTSLDRGLTWTPNALYENPAWNVAGDPVAVSDAAGRTYLVCMPFSRGPNPGEMDVLTSLDGGETWVNTANSGVSGGSNLDDKPWAAAYGNGTIVVVWDDFPSAGGENLLARTSFDAGASWTPTVTIASNGFYPGLDFDRYGRLHLVYMAGGSQRYRYSDDFGLTWSPRVTIATAGSGGGSPRSAPIPQIASDPTGQDLYIMWGGDRGDPGGEIVYLAYSHDAGQNWTRVTIGDDTTDGMNWRFVDVDHNGVVHMLWSDLRSGQHPVYYANSTDGGITISNDIRVSDVEAPTTGFQGDYQQIVVDDWGRAHLAYCDSRNGGDAFYARGELSTPGPHWVNISPEDAIVPMGSTLQYTATVTDPYGNMPSDAVEWRVSGGGTVGLTGLFTPSALGTYIVSVYSGFRFDNTTVTVAPGPLASIVVDPPITLVAAGNTTPFTAQGFDAFANAVPVSPTWAVTNGSIDAGGIFSPWSTGTWTVYANQSGVSGTTFVTVTPGVLASIEVTPDGLTIAADDTQQYVATGYDLFGNVVPITPIWTTNAGSVNGTGLYTPGPAGTWVVSASVGPLFDSATVTVLPGALATLVVSPSSITITAYQTQQYTAVGFDAKGNSVPVAPTWSVDGGTINATGLYSPAFTGLYRVTAAQGSVSDDALVTVVAGALASIVVSPPSPTITADETQLFTATGYDAKGNLVGILPTWAVTGGSVSGTGLFTPSVVGTFTVYANQSAVSGSATVNVVAAMLAQLVVSPDPAAITTDETQPFTAAGRDAKGNSVPVAPTWSVDGGSINPAGLYTPTPVGTFTVTATVGVIQDTATILVSVGVLARIDVTPTPVTITADEFQLFSAAGFDARGNPVGVNPTWAAGGGSIAGGFYTPSLAGTFPLYASQASVTGTAVITVQPGAVDRVVVTPPSPTITVDETQPFTAVAYDAKDNVVTGTFSWFAQAGTISAAGLYTPGPLGTYAVRATLGGRTGSAAITVEHRALVPIT